MFERFTERARLTLVYAQDEARALKHDYLGTEHLLLGLLRLDEGPAARVFDSLDITVEEVRAEVARIVGQGEEVSADLFLPMTRRSKKVLERALHEALSLRRKDVRPEQILLGLVSVDQGLGARILLGLDADAAKIRNEVTRAISDPQPYRSPRAASPMPHRPPPPPGLTFERPPGRAIDSRAMALPKRFPDRDEIAAVRAEAEKLEPGSEGGDRRRLAGRVMARRDMGKLVFLDLVDRSGRIQLLWEEGRAGPVDLDLGDLVGVSGVPARTKRGEPSLAVEEAQLLAKIKQPLPDTFHGLTDVEARYRRRYLDLLMNEETRGDFVLRTRMVTAIRR
ncbi:MAG TPA: Clp protease N-terminal domain-containing protein, partial [Gaiellaceae bacterium]|nr:Clp protease N-terminal domain-containing protein [Gaiellaceae bacterium]